MLQEVFDYLKTVCGDLHMTRGDFDNAGSRYPEEKVPTLSRHLPFDWQCITLCNMGPAVLQQPPPIQGANQNNALFVCRCSALAALKLGFVTDTR